MKIRFIISTISIGSDVAIDIIQMNEKLSHRDLYNRKLTVSGWGHTESSDDCQPNLWKTTNNILSSTQVWDNYKLNYKNDRILVTDNKLGQRACPGDSGGSVKIALKCRIS